MALTQGVTKKVGPCGGSGGYVRDMNINGITHIFKISVRHAGAIDALTIHFLRNGGCVESTQLWGGQGGYLSEVSEYITSVKGHIGTYNNWVVVRSLKFETNLGSFGPFGTQEGLPFELPAIGGKIIGFHGRSGGLLDALGVYVQVPTQGLTKKVGPCGGNGGYVRDMNIYGITRITKISVRHAGAIDALHVGFLRNDREEYTELWGGQGGCLTEFNLQACEYIISVKGHIGTYNNWVVLRSLTFETNLRSFGPCGTQEGIPFELPAIGGQIIGFYGRSGGLLDAIGVYVQDREGIVRTELEDCKQKLKHKDAEYLKNLQDLRIQLDSKDHLQKKIESKVKHLENENELLQIKFNHAEAEYLKQSHELRGELDSKDGLQKKLESKIEYLENENELLQTKFKNTEAEYLKNSQELRAELDSKDGLQKKLESKIEHLENENELLRTKEKDLNAEIKELLQSIENSDEER